VGVEEGHAEAFPTTRQVHRTDASIAEHWRGRGLSRHLDRRRLDHGRRNGGDRLSAAAGREQKRRYCSAYDNAHAKILHQQASVASTRLSYATSEGDTVGM
jgi:hypothetical protein